MRPLKVSSSADAKKSRARSMEERHVFVKHEYLKVGVVCGKTR